MEDALATVRGEPVALTVAGRTDAGVHALGQVASHAGEPLPLGAWNGNLPPDVRVLASEAAPDGFDARRDATAPHVRLPALHARARCRRFERGRALHWPHRLDREALDACAALLPGKHDLTAFTPHPDRARAASSATSPRPNGSDAGEHVLEFRIEAPSFMRNQVRILVGTMLEVGRGRMAVEDFARLLEGRPRAEAGEHGAAPRPLPCAVRY